MSHDRHDWRPHQSSDTRDKRLSWDLWKLNPQQRKENSSGKRIATTEALQTWADEQLSILKTKGATVEQLYWAASNLSNADLDPIDAISFPVVFPNSQYNLLPFENMFNLLQQTQIACLKSRRLEFAETNVPPMVIENLPTLRPVTSGNLIRLDMDGARPKHPFSLLGCLDRLSQTAGPRADIRNQAVAVTNYAWSHGRTPH